jgi:hypothetical protein
MKNNWKSLTVSRSELSIYILRAGMKLYKCCCGRKWRGQDIQRQGMMPGWNLIYGLPI